MFTITRDYKIADLKTRLSYWHSTEGQKKYINEVRTNENIFSKRFGIETVSGGYYYLSDNLVGFFDTNTGTLFRIRKLMNGDAAWNCFNDLYQASLTADFNVEKPIHREVLSIDGLDWDYAEVESPNGEYGKNYEYEIFDWPALVDGRSANPSITDAQRAEHVALVKSNIDEIHKVFPYAFKAAQDNGAGFPLSMLNMSSIYRDSKCTFWSDLNFANWNDMPLQKEVFVQYLNKVISGALVFGKRCGMINDDEIGDVLAYLNSKDWS